MLTNHSRSYTYLFGPVPSRRLGRSLGIDLIPYKICTQNCVYCECGMTTERTAERKEYVPTEKVLSELEDYLGQNPELDYITFSGSGEPTLHSGIGKIARFIKSRWPQYKLALLTNSTLFGREDVRDDCMYMDLILPSLDTVSGELEEQINRTVESISPEEVVSGLIEFSREFKGEIWIEVFIVPGINDTNDEIDRIKEVLMKVDPDRVQLNWLDRPGTESWIKVPERTGLEKMKERLAPLPVEIIGKFKGQDHEVYKKRKESVVDDILGLLARRPSTLEDIEEAVGVHITNLREICDDLIKEGVIAQKEEQRGTFYFIPQEKNRS